MNLGEYVNKLNKAFLLKEAVLNKKRNSLRLTIACSKLIPVSQLERAKNDIRELVQSKSHPDVDCSVNFVFYDLLEQIEKHPSVAKQLLDELADCLPTIAHVLRHSNLEMENGKLVLYYPTGAMDLFGYLNVENKINAVLIRRYGIIDGIVSYPSAQLMLPKPVYQETDGYVSGTSKNTVQQEDADLICGKPIKEEPIQMCDLTEVSNRVVVMGSIISFEARPLNKGGTLLLFGLTDKTNSINCKLFLNKGEKGEQIQAAITQCMNSKKTLKVNGRYVFDTFMGEMCLHVADVVKVDRVLREDKAEKKRVELHLHTKFSSMDALLEADLHHNDAVETAARWGHKAVAITDHGVVHGFPSAVGTASKLGIKVLLGVEGYLIDDGRGISDDGRFAVIDIYMDDMGEPALVVSAAAFDTGNMPEDPFIWRLPVQGATIKSENFYDVVSHMLEFAPDRREQVGKLFSTIEGCTAVITFDRDALKILNDAASTMGHSTEHFIDINALIRHTHTRIYVPTLENIAVFFGDEVPVTAVGRLELFARWYKRLVAEAHESGKHEIPMNIGFTAGYEKTRGHNARHIILLARTAEGLKNLYKLVSFGHTEYFRGVPRIPRTMLMSLRDGIIVGSACEAGELFRAVLEGKDDDEIERIARFYDYLEVQPIGNNDFLRREGKVDGIEGLRALNRKIVELGDRLGIPVVATGDVHFLEPDDSIYRTILMHSKGFADSDIQAPLYFKTTDEMLEEFSYLGEDKAYEIVVKTPNMIADMCDKLKPYLDEQKTYAPTFPGANEELSNMAITMAHKIYGEELPEIVEKRLDKELNSIIKNGYASLYLMAQRLVRKSLSDGYLVGSRGSVGSSFVATMAGITEVNPLPAHYVCPNCQYSDFNFADRLSHCGVDLEDKDCPVCGTPLNKLGYDIPFEVFLGFKGDKTPDIDLNFSGDYQPVAHAYTEEMFGKGHAFRAGTIATVKDKTAFGYVKSYCDDKGIRATNIELSRLAQGCSGVKRTTGQHPGGIVIVPEEYEIFDFTPVQYPADKQDGDIVTTHFDFHAMDDKLVKLDILGHDDPTALRMLFDLTGVDPKTIPLDDKRTMSLFSSTEALGVDLKAIDCDVGSIAIPEFGTSFVRGMLVDTRPTTMEELVRISGLSHGENLWLGNAQDLIKNGTATLSEVICLRDDIMTFLISHGGDPSMSFKTMEAIRKGKHVSPEMEGFMTSINVPRWYIDSADKIKYMFPRAHAAAYVMMAFRIAYYKLNYPLEFYATYLSVRADALALEDVQGGPEDIVARIKEIKRDNNSSSKDEDKIPVLEVVYEMMLRGIKLLPLDLYKSQAKRFVIEDGALRPPFISVSGIGENAALELEKAAKCGKFLSREDFIKRSKANSAVIQKLEQFGILGDLSATNQMSLFDTVLR